MAADIDQLLKAKQSTSNTFSFDDSSVNITLYNLRNLYLLFKPDVISSLVSFNPYYFKSSTHSSNSNKPHGISIKQKYNHLILKKREINFKLNIVYLLTRLSECSEEQNINNSFVVTTNNCPGSRETLVELDASSTLNCTGPDKDSEKCLNLAETVQVYKDDDELTINDLNSTIRRAMHCSFTYKDYMYVIGGYSYSNQSSFVSRLNVNTLRWEHKLDRKASTVVNRANRKLFGNINYKQPKLEVPQNRYAHSCALDTKNVSSLTKNVKIFKNHLQFLFIFKDVVYMFGGVIYNNEKYAQFSYKETTNELWSLNLLTNKWTWLNADGKGASTGRQALGSSSIPLSGRSLPKSYVLPIGVSGHTMHLIRNAQDNMTLINIFFGYSEYYGSNLNLIQEYNIGEN